MILYLAGLGGEKSEVRSYVLENFPNIGALCSFANPKEFENLVKTGFKNIMVDSGAYSVSKKGIIIDIDKYIGFLSSNSEKITVAVALDVIGNPEQTYKNYLYMLNKRIDNLIPTFHLGEDIKWLDLYCNKSNFVGIGGIAGRVTDWKLYHPFLTRIVNRYPNHKFHTFGLNSYKALRMVNVYSCDATSWLSGRKFAQIFTSQGSIKLRKEHVEKEVWELLENEWGITRVDFDDNKHDFNKLNLLNIRFLYDLINNHKKIEVSEQMEIF